MSNSILDAITLMLVGMMSVFIVLTFVVVGGNLLIRFINKYYPVSISEQSDNRSDNKTIAVIAAAVHHVTKGKGKIDDIRKM